jgi:peptidoglycan L-alanyl-D-glutamate endopeptidase CwlK
MIRAGWKELYSPIGSGGGGTGSGAGVPDPNMRRTDLDSLHPVMRDSAIHLLTRLESEQIPFRLFEGFRTPWRQAWLYAQGRTRPGAKVTNAQAWQSYHQHGLAADFVLWLNNQWSWSTVGAHRRYWKRLQDLGQEVGLEPLSWELPHLQVAGLKLADLQSGIYPNGGDDAWRDNLEAAVVGWNGEPAAPALASLRPAMPRGASA